MLTQNANPFARATRINNVSSYTILRAGLMDRAGCDPSNELLVWLHNAESLCPLPVSAAFAWQPAPSTCHIPHVNQVVTSLLGCRVGTNFGHRFSTNVKFGGRGKWR